MGNCTSLTEGCQSDGETPFDRNIYMGDHRAAHDIPVRHSQSDAHTTARSEVHVDGASDECKHDATSATSTRSELHAHDASGTMAEPSPSFKANPVMTDSEMSERFQHAETMLEHSEQLRMRMEGLLNARNSTVHAFRFPTDLQKLQHTPGDPTLQASSSDDVGVGVGSPFDVLPLGAQDERGLSTEVLSPKGSADTTVKPCEFNSSSTMHTGITIDAADEKPLPTKPLPTKRLTSKREPRRACYSPGGLHQIHQTPQVRPSLHTARWERRIAAAKLSTQDGNP